MPDFYDPPERLLRLIDLQSPKIAAGFRDMISHMKADVDLAEVADLLERRLITTALDAVLRRSGSVAKPYIQTFVRSAEETAKVLGQGFDSIVMDFDAFNPWAVRSARENQLRLVREFTQGQIRATNEALIDGIQRGANPREMARAFRDSIGLTQRQVQIVNNYRTNLETGSSQALTRALRDRRFDPTVRRAIEGETSLSGKQIDRMVGRYQERWIKYRSEVIGRTESLRAVHQGNDAMYEQAIEAGDLQRENTTQEWSTASDERVRDSHSAMHAQIQILGDPFISGLGNQLLYPGDPGAPGEDTIQCRCTLGTRIVRVEVPEGFSVSVAGA